MTTGGAAALEVARAPVDGAETVSRSSSADRAAGDRDVDRPPTREFAGGRERRRSLVRPRTAPRGRTTGTNG
ncbi:MAG: hypothetical protein ACLGI3_15145, partial [Actinomycetes bacterium]